VIRLLVGLTRPAPRPPRRDRPGPGLTQGPRNATPTTTASTGRSTARPSARR
jgi:hypothetical protein